MRRYCKIQTKRVLVEFKSRGNLLKSKVISIILAYAIVLVPSCKQRTEESEAKASVTDNYKKSNWYGSLSSQAKMDNQLRFFDDFVADLQRASANSDLYYFQIDDSGNKIAKKNAVDGDIVPSRPLYSKLAEYSSFSYATEIKQKNKIVRVTTKVFKDDDFENPFDFTSSSIDLNADEETTKASILSAKQSIRVFESKMVKLESQKMLKKFQSLENISIAVGIIAGISAVAGLIFSFYILSGAASKALASHQIIFLGMLFLGIVLIMISIVPSATFNKRQLEIIQSKESVLSNLENL